MGEKYKELAEVGCWWLIEGRIWECFGEGWILKRPKIRTVSRARVQWVKHPRARDKVPRKALQAIWVRYTLSDSSFSKQRELISLRPLYHLFKRSSSLEIREVCIHKFSRIHSTLRHAIVGGNMGWVRRCSGSADLWALRHLSQGREIYNRYVIHRARGLRINTLGDHVRLNNVTYVAKTYILIQYLRNAS